MEGAGAPLEFALAERPHDLLAIAAVLLDQLRSPLAGEPGFANKKIHLVVSAGGELKSGLACRASMDCPPCQFPPVQVQSCKVAPGYRRSSLAVLRTVHGQICLPIGLVRIRQAHIVRCAATMGNRPCIVVG